VTSSLAQPEPTTVPGFQTLVGDRILTRPELEVLVAAVSARPALWEPRIDRRSDQRMYASLHRDAHVDVWAIFWRPGNDTGWHDHDVSSGAVHVVQGALTNASLRIGAPDHRRTHRAGESFSFDPTQIHRLTCETETAISIHAYSAPLWRLGQYSVDADGGLRRLSVSYADELRPLELFAA
jgi:predicted metal-dependent enzyme (double-stranded beta helix superfamily)